MVLSCLFHCLIGKKNTGTECNYSDLLGKKNTGTECNYSDFSKVSYNTLFEATDRFSSANLIGKGTFGSVYKVVLDIPPHRPQVVAVKLFDMLHPGVLKSFIAECEAFRNMGHRNIVKIITTCSSTNFKALVYEFMENGSLEEWLHPTTGTQKLRSPTKNLSLVERLDIAIDVACALDYLHNHCKTPILHCDLKPSNILLDKNLTGRVSDFGLARFLCKPSNISTNQTTVSGLSGSVSYIAPEYYKMGSEASTYGDVYSFGILLLELFTGLKPSEDMFSDGLNLHNFVKTALFDGIAVLAEIADSRLLLQGGNDYPPSEFSVNFILEIEECLRLIFQIGIVCSRESPRDRMNIRYVVSELQSIRADFLNRLDSYNQTVGLRSTLCSIENERSRLCSRCIVCQPRMNKQTAWSSSNRCYGQFCASRLVSPPYEFMDNGSLELWLHPSTRTEDVRDAPKNLSLIQRLEIAIDVACALDFLHNSYVIPIVYCDLQPSNVLLDTELIGHVSDTDLTGVMGSVGYTAPEYGRGSWGSTYADAYSFGILLLEMFTGKRPTDHMFNDGLMNLHSFVKMAIPERVIKIADSRLLLQGCTNDTRIIEECLISIFRIGIACSVGAPRDRMNINCVVLKLRFIRRRLLA